MQWPLGDARLAVGLLDRLLGRMPRPKRHNRTGEDILSNGHERQALTVERINDDEGEGVVIEGGNVVTVYVFGRDDSGPLAKADFRIQEGTEAVRTLVRRHMGSRDD
jgi:hypothetical protein